MSETINSTGTGGYGILNSGENNTKIINGIIATSGATAIGIYSMIFFGNNGPY